MAIKMGKNKQNAKEKKFDRKVEISAPILDPEIIKAIHSPPPEHAGFKELLSGINSQDSIDEVTLLDDRHIPSYIGISCAVSGYTSYSSLARQAIERARGNTPIGDDNVDPKKTSSNNISYNSSRPTSPVLIKGEAQINHITLDKSNIHSPDEERKKLTQKLTASANENCRSPSPTIPPTEDDRHHGAYVGARYCPLTPPPNVISTNKHIPLLGIDDELNEDKVVDDDNSSKKVEQRIASLYGEDFAGNWRESMSNKSTKQSQPIDEEAHKMEPPKTPKDLVKLKSATTKTIKNTTKNQVDNETDDQKEKSTAPLGKAKNFLGKLFGGNRPKSPSTTSTTSGTTNNETKHLINEIKLSPNVATESIGSGDLKEEAKAQSRTISNPTTEISRDPVVNPELDKMIIDDREKSMESNREQLNTQNEIIIEKLDDMTHEKEESNIVHLSDQCSQPIASESADIDNQQPDEPEQRILSKEVKSYYNSPEETKTSPTDSASKGGQYYLGLLAKERASLQNLVNEAKIYENEDREQDGERVGEIRAAIGKANLLINKKFKQFEELCDANINKSPGEQFATLDDDLAGFWDMIVIQLNDIKRAFNTIEQNAQQQQQQTTTKSSDEASENETSLGSTTSSQKTTSNEGNKPKLSAKKDQERRERLKEHINQMKAKATTNNTIDQPELLSQNIESATLDNEFGNEKSSSEDLAEKKLVTSDQEAGDGDKSFDQPIEESQQGGTIQSSHEESKALESQANQNS